MGEGERRSRGRPRTRLKLPEPFYEGMPVKVRSSEYPVPKLGLIKELCKYDGGIMVWLTSESINGVSKYVCIQPERGDTIEGIEIEPSRRNPQKR